MNLYIFGHSICGRATPFRPVKTFVDALFEKYNVPYDHLYTYKWCSEERILYFLKKVKKPDAVIIFHSLPNVFFVPGLERDFDTINDNNYFWKDPNWSHLNYYQSVVDDRALTEADWNTLKQNNRRYDSYLNNSEFKKIYYDYLKYFHTHDLTVNRYHGALTQIDQYLQYKKIPAVHCVNSVHIPTWFKFSNGIVDTELWNFQASDSPYHCSHARLNNAVTEEGNKIITDTLVGYIERLVGAVGIEPT